MSDVIYAAHAAEHRYMTFQNMEGISSEVDLVRDWESIYCIRLNVDDQPGVLSSISGVFAKHDVSLETVLQVGGAKNGKADITFITHKAQELSVQAALDEIRMLPVVASIDNLIRVEEN